MCFGKTKTVKLLKASKNNTRNNIELGYNTIDSCEYINYEDIPKLKNSQNDLRVVQKWKLDELDILISDLKQPDIIIINETWLKEGEEKCINIKGYTFEGVPRVRKKEGGVGFLVKEGLVYRALTELNNSNIDPTLEHYYIELKGNKYNVILGSIYRPPNTNLERFMVEYKSSLEWLSKLKN